MTDIVITLNFSTDDGVSELFDYISILTPDFPVEGTYDGADGNPSGSMTFYTATPADGGQTYRYTQTLEGWGVPPGAVVTNISLLTADAKGESTGATFNYYPTAALRLGSGLGYPSYKESSTAWNGNHVWEALTAEYGDTISYPVASTVDLSVEVVARAGGGTSHQMWYDNLIFTISYGAGADSSGTGALQAQAAFVSGEGTAKMVVYATGVLQAQAPTISGYAQSLPSATEPAKANTADSYLLYADAVAVPLIQFTVRRDTIETASITAPVVYEDLMAGATVISIDIVSMDDYGAETVTELFTGALDTYSTSRSGVVVNCLGAATWPANAVRDFGNVSFITDDANYNAYRASIDPRFYPGDVGMYGFRRINVNKVTFSVNRTQAFMELSDVGQV